MYYGPVIMQQIGIFDGKNKDNALYASMPLSFINFLGTLVAILLIDSKGY